LSILSGNRYVTSLHRQAITGTESKAMHGTNYGFEDGYTVSPGCPIVGIPIQFFFVLVHTAGKTFASTTKNSHPGIGFVFKPLPRFCQVGTELCIDGVPPIRAIQCYESDPVFYFVEYRWFCHGLFPPFPDYFYG
jgi:hypothetical protein